MKEFGNLAINAIKGLSSLRGDDDVRDDQRCRLHHEMRDLSNEELLERIRQKVVDLVARVSFPGDFCQFSEMGDPLDESGVARPDDSREQFYRMVKERLAPIFEGKIVANG